MNRRNLILIGIVLVLVALPVVWWLASPLFIDQAVDEAFPFEAPTESQVAAMSDQEKEEVLAEIMTVVSDEAQTAELTDETQAAMAKTVAAVGDTMPDKALDDPMPTPAADEWMAVATGQFMDADDFHQGSGTATLYQQGDKRVLRFEDFDSTNGPDLHVLLVENVDGTSSDELGEYVDLGQLKGNVGNQNYDIPDEVDLDRYSGIVIYCMPFHVVFSTATLAR